MARQSWCFVLDRCDAMNSSTPSAVRDGSKSDAELLITGRGVEKLLLLLVRDAVQRSASPTPPVCVDVNTIVSSSADRYGRSSEAVPLIAPSSRVGAPNEDVMYRESRARDPDCPIRPRESNTCRESARQSSKTAFHLKMMS